MYSLKALIINKAPVSKAVFMLKAASDCAFPLLILSAKKEGRFDCQNVFELGFSVQIIFPSLSQFRVGLPLSVTFNNQRPILSSLN
jgi:hypothetical protein